MVREFETGATRDTDDGKLDFEGFFSPLVLQRRAEYMHQHRIQADGELRESDNWQKGIPFEAYMKSAWRHFFAWWKRHRGLPANESLEDALCALMFNTEGYLHELLTLKEEAAARVVHFDPESPPLVLTKESNSQWGDRIRP